MADHPLKHRTRYDQSPQTKRRALTPDEIRRLLDAARGWRRLVYEVALCSGLRAKELRSLRRSDLDTERGGLVLHAVWTKNRKDGFQPLPSVLVEELRAFAESGEAAQLYRGYVPRPQNRPRDPLLYLPHNTSRMFDEDREAAGIPKRAFGGHVDFHALRVAYVTGILESGASVKEAQTLARHSTPALTMNIYGRTRDARLSALANRLGAAMLGSGEEAETGEDHATYMPKKAVGGAARDETRATLARQRCFSSLPALRQPNGRAGRNACPTGQSPPHGWGRHSCLPPHR